MTQYLDKQYIEGQLSRFQERFVPLLLTTIAGSRQITLADPTLIFVDGSTPGYILILPNATELETGYHITIHNNSSNYIDIRLYGGGPSVILTSGGRLSVLLKSNSTTAGVWLRAISSSSPFTGTSPVLGSYVGNAGVGRYLEIYPGQGSDTAPFYVPTNVYIVAFEYSTVATSTSTLGVFKLSDPSNAIYTITLSAGTTVFGTNLTVPLVQGDQVAFKVTAAIGNVSKPRCALYFTGY